MAINSGNDKSGNESKITWEKPRDIRQLEKVVPVTKRQFSLELLSMRFNQFDDETQKRALKVMDALRTGYFCRL